MRIKDKLKQWLFKDELEIINNIAAMEREVNQAVDRLRIATNIAHESKVISQESYDTNLQIQKLVTPLLDVGTDIGFGNDHSWAVICIKGRPEYVKFVPLEHRDARDVMEFLKRYQRSSHVIDSPLAFRSMIKNELFI